MVNNAMIKDYKYVLDYAVYYYNTSVIKQYFAIVDIYWDIFKY